MMVRMVVIFDNEKFSCSRINRLIVIIMLFVVVKIVLIVKCYLNWN